METKVPEKLTIPVTSSINDIEYLTMQGGGRKGTAYVGAVEELEVQGLLAQIKEVAGSSAGGLMSILLAVGYNAAEVRELMLDMDFKMLQDKRELGWVESTHLGDVVKATSGVATGIKDAIGGITQIPILGSMLGVAAAQPIQVINKVAEVAAKSADVISVASKAEEVVGLALGTGLGLWEGEAMLSWLAEVVARKTGNPNITFGQLAELAEVSGSPFKKLILTGSNLTDGLLQYFNAENTPDMPIIVAARISASFPGGYKPVITVEKDKDGKEKKTVWVDGGLLENLPDVFNKLPYLTPDRDNGHGGNKKAFALSLITPEEKAELEAGRQIQRMHQHLGAIVSTKFSEEGLVQKYGQNIARIDTVGVGTLEFKLPPEKEKKLVQSGTDTVHTAIESILKSEEKVKPYDSYSDEELVRIITELQHDTDGANKKKALPYIKVLNGRNISEKRLEELNLKAEQDYQRIIKLKDPRNYSDGELTKLCADKRSVLMSVELELQGSVAQLKLAKAALEYNAKQLHQEFKQNKEFQEQLQELLKQEEALNAIMLFKADPRKGAQRENLKKQEKELLDVLKKSYDKIINDYGNNPLLKGFFESLKEDRENPDFKIPTTEEALIAYCDKDIKQCDDLLKGAEHEAAKGIHQLNSFRHHQAGFEKRTDKDKKHAALLKLRLEIDHAILRKTTFIIKLNHFLTQKAPKIKPLITPCLKALGVISFICTLPLALPAVPIALAIRKFAKDTDTKETANNVVRFFKKSDIDRDEKLRAFRDVINQCVKVMQKNYVTADNSEETYLHRLHTIYMKNSGIDLETIMKRKVDESSKDFKERVNKVKSQLESAARNPEVEAEDKDKISVYEMLREDEQAAVEHNIAEFRKQIEHDIKLVNISEASNNNMMQAKNREQETKNIDQEDLRGLDRKMKDKEKLTKEEVERYLKACKSLERELPKMFLEINANILEVIEREQNAKDKQRIHELRETKQQEEIGSALQHFKRKRQEHNRQRTDNSRPNKPKAH